jgi:hypothetical protein
MISRGGGGGDACRFGTCIVSTTAPFIEYHSGVCADIRRLGWTVDDRQCGKSIPGACRRRDSVLDLRLD